jgi:hypothetical protein
MTREQAIALWNSMCDEQGGDVPIEAVADLIANVENAALERVAMMIERTTFCECCAGLAQSVRTMTQGAALGAVAAPTGAQDRTEFRPPAGK